jgi:hypothetical protein
MDSSLICVKSRARSSLILFVDRVQFTRTTDGRVVSTAHSKPMPACDAWIPIVRVPSVLIDVQPLLASVLAAGGGRGDD